MVYSSLTRILSRMALRVTPSSTQPMNRLKVGTMIAVLQETHGVPTVSL